MTMRIYCQTHETTSSLSLRQDPRQEWSQCPAHLATTQQSPLPQMALVWVCLHSHGTTQNRLLLIAQDSEPGEEGAVMVGDRDGGGALAVNE